jgi:4-amino-4-deoxy-L-arabinose transferase-like glycosyltransferase
MLPAHQRQLLAALLIGVTLRALWALAIPVVPVSDSAAYDAFARTFSEHGVFGWTKDEPFAFWPPGTTFLHATLYSLFGTSYTSIVVANIAISGGVIWSAARVAHRLFSPRIAIATAWVLALWPTLVIYVTVIASELPFLLLITVALDIWTKKEQPTIISAVVAGVLLGAAALVRPVALLLPIVYGVAWALGDPRLRQHFGRHLACIAVATIAMATVIAPWTYRNYQLYGERVLISTNGGITFWMGNTPGTDGSYMDPPTELNGVPDNELEKILNERAWQYIRAEPGEFALRTLRKFARLYSNESIGVLWNEPGIAAVMGEAAVTPMKRVTQLSWGALFVVGLAGVWTLARQRGLWPLLISPPFVIIGYFTVVYSFTVSMDRYHLSFATMMAIFMAIGATSLIDAARRVSPGSNPLG